MNTQLYNLFNSYCKFWESFGYDFCRIFWPNKKVQSIKPEQVTKITLKAKATEFERITELKPLQAPVLKKSGPFWSRALQKIRHYRANSCYSEQVRKYLSSIGWQHKDSQKSCYFESVIEEDRCLRLGDKYCRIYYLADLPHYIAAASLIKLINLPLPLELSYHIQGTNKSAMIRAARQRLSVLESARNSDLKKNRNSDPEIAREYEEVNVFLNDLVQDNERSFLLSIYAAITASSKEELLANDRKFQDETQDIEFTYNTYSFAQRRAFTPMLPLGKDNLQTRHLLQTSAVINLLPFLTRNFNDPTGIFFGSNHYNSSLILIDLFKARNANMNIFGTSGSGKSVTAKLIMTRLLLRGVQNLIIDPEGEYGALTSALGGNVIRFDREHGIDPFRLFPLNKDEYKDYVQILKHFFAFFIQEEHQDYALLDKLLMETYYTEGEPCMSKFMDIIQAQDRTFDRGFLTDLTQLTTGSLSELFANPCVFDLNNDMICFDLSSLHSDEKKIPMIYLIGNIINKLINKGERRRMIFIDEAHKLLVNKASTSFYVDLVKTARKRRAGVVSITQNPEDFKEDDNSKTIITQSETTILLKQAHASINYIKRFNLFQLTDRESNDLGCLGIGEALFIREREHIYLDVFPFRSERELVFTS